MLATLVRDTYVEIDLSLDEGSLFGYVVDTRECNLKNWLEDIEQVDQLDTIRSSYDRVAIIKNIWVDEDARGQGIGTSLLDDALYEAELNGAQAVLLEADTSEDNRFNLVSWYKDFEFDIISKQDETYPLMLKSID